MIENIEKRKHKIKIINITDGLTYYQFFYIPFISLILSFIFDLYFIYILIGFILYSLLFILKTELFEVKKIFKKIIKSIILFILCFLIGFGIINYISKTLGLGINDNKNINIKTQILNDKLINVSKNSLDLNINIIDLKKVKNEEYIKSEEFFKLLKDGDCGEKYKKFIFNNYDAEIANKIVDLYNDGYYSKGLIKQTKRSEWINKNIPDYYILGISGKNIKFTPVVTQIYGDNCNGFTINKINEFRYTIETKIQGFKEGLMCLHEIKDNKGIIPFLQPSYGGYGDENLNTFLYKYISKKEFLPIDENFCKNFQ